MLGKSLYLSSTKDVQNKTIATLKKGDYCFISLHTPEDFIEDFSSVAMDLIDRINRTDAKIIADIAPVGIKNMGYESFEDLAKANLVWGLRPDYGLTTQQILDAAKHTNIVLNASIIDTDLVEALYEDGANIYAMHNFYPRPETALDVEYCLECNDYLHAYGATVFAFISSQNDFRGPIFAGLPTIEEFRTYNPYLQYVLLKNLLEIDVVFVGDISIDQWSEDQINMTEETGVITLPCEVDTDFVSKFCNKPLTIRHDSNSLLARVQESRTYANYAAKIEPKNNEVERVAGSITIDNVKYVRYSGEVMIVLDDLPADERVNVVGHIKDEFLSVLEILTGDTKIQFVRN